MLEEKGSTLLKSGTTIAELIRRPELNYEDLAPIDKERPELPWDVKQQVEINLKYETAEAGRAVQKTGSKENSGRPGL